MTLVQTLIHIALGGALGAVSRFGMSVAVLRLTGPAFPFGTLAVNVLGSFAMGVAFAAILHRWDDSRMVPLIMTGFLGGFTTFSAFSLDAVQLIDKGRVTAAALYIGGSVGLSVLALWLGLALAKGYWA